MQVYKSLFIFIAGGRQVDPRLLHNLCVYPRYNAMSSEGLWPWHRMRPGTSTSSVPKKCAIFTTTKYVSCFTACVNFEICSQTNLVCDFHAAAFLPAVWRIGTCFWHIASPRFQLSWDRYWYFFSSTKAEDVLRLGSQFACHRALIHNSELS